MHLRFTRRGPGTRRHFAPRWAPAAAEMAGDEHPARSGPCLGLAPNSAPGRATRGPCAGYKGAPEGHAAGASNKRPTARTQPPTSLHSPHHLQVPTYLPTHPLESPSFSSSPRLRARSRSLSLVRLACSRSLGAALRGSRNCRPLSQPKARSPVRRRTLHDPVEQTSQSRPRWLRASLPDPIAYPDTRPWEAQASWYVPPRSNKDRRLIGAGKRYIYCTSSLGWVHNIESYR